MHTATAPHTRRFGSAIAVLGIALGIVFGQFTVTGTASASPAHSASIAAPLPTRITLDSRSWYLPQVPVIGTLHTRYNRTVAGQTVVMFSRAVNSPTWIFIGAAHTDAHGRFVFWDVGVTNGRFYQARFNGSDKFNPSASNIARVTGVKSRTSIVVNQFDSTVSYGGGYSLRGMLLERRGWVVLHQRLELWSKNVGTAKWNRVTTSDTGESGYYSISLTNLTVSADYQIRFLGSANYAKSSSPMVRTVVSQARTSLSASSSSSSVVYGDGVVVTGNLSGFAGANLAGQWISLYGMADNSGMKSWALIAASSTDDHGRYTINTGNLNGTTTLQARFGGSGSNAASSSQRIVVTVTAPPTVSPPVTSPPATSPPVAAWSNDPSMAAKTFTLINAYRAQSGLSQLVQMPADTTASTDACVAKNTAGTFCDPYNLAAGYLNADDTVTGWKNSPGHNVAMIDPNWSTMSCSAYMKNDGSNAFVGCNFDF